MRRACRIVQQHHSMQYYASRLDPRTALRKRMREIAQVRMRYGYRRIAALLRDAGWQVNDKRIERLWRREGLKVPMKQPKRTSPASAPM